MSGGVGGCRGAIPVTRPDQRGRPCVGAPSETKGRPSLLREFPVNQRGDDPFEGLDIAQVSYLGGRVRIS